ncbi:MAG TPA: GNAT family N-acetyltransferase [Actinocrinis sp.]|nr:GNAT family N-acetyltransferase [Actinocrinis sp.]
MTATVDHLSCRPGFDPPTLAGPTPASLVLDQAVWASLTGPHARLAERHGRAARYQTDVAGFAALEDPADPRAWADAAELLGPDGRLTLTGVAHWPEDWEPAFTGKGVQMVDTAVAACPDPEAVLLGPQDVPEMLALVDRTAPGPFLPRTIELGRYLGIRRDGALVAMAGERLHPPGWTEISAVCTDPAYRGQGLATRLVRAVAAGIRQRGETPFLHTVASNTNAIRLYESIGFTLRRRSSFTVLISPLRSAG